MGRLVLVRHGRAAASWDADHDPGLDDVGRVQAEAAADALTGFGPVPILVSPLRRTRETAAPLEKRWSVRADVVRAVGEIPSPTDDLAERGRWLAAVLATPWPELDPSLRDWRDGVVEALLAVDGDAVVVTHFVAINVAVGEATGDDRLVCFHPDNGSRTVLETAGGRLQVVELGAQASTVVQ